MAKVVQWNETCNNTKCMKEFYVHVKPENMPKEPFITVKCPHCKTTWDTVIDWIEQREVCYAR